MGKAVFRQWDVDQGELFPPAFKDLVPSSHLVHFVRRMVAEDLDLSEIYKGYASALGQPPYHPGLMTALLLYGYCRGVYTSRRLEVACEERLDFRALVGAERPDHSTIAEFRKRHRDSLAGLFVQVLSLCRDAGMVKLGHVALDGTKMRANASKHAAMSYKRMKEVEPELAKEVETWLDAAQQGDDSEDAACGEGNRGDELPEHIQAKIKKLAKMRASMAEMEAEAEAEEERASAGIERETKEAEKGAKLRGRKPLALTGVTADKTQKNFTDPQSRIMKTASGYVQGYNAQAAVDAEHQIIVAVSVTDEQNDSNQLISNLKLVEQNLGCLPKQVSADAGYCSEKNLEALASIDIDPYIATGRQKHGKASPDEDTKPKGGPRTQEMRDKLRKDGWKSPYRLRKQVVEPVFGQIKEARGFRTFLMRGLQNVRTEWALIGTVHNLLKLARLPRPAAAPA